jgi:hypothetical protein
MNLPASLQPMWRATPNCCARQIFSRCDFVLVEESVRETTVAGVIRRPPADAPTRRMPAIYLVGVRSSSKSFHGGRDGSCC